MSDVNLLLLLPTTSSYRRHLQCNRKLDNQFAEPAIIVAVCVQRKVLFNLHELRALQIDHIDMSVVVIIGRQTLVISLHHPPTCKYNKFAFRCLSWVDNNPSGKYVDNQKQRFHLIDSHQMLLELESDLHPSGGP